MRDRLFSSLNLLLDNVEGTNLLLDYLCGFSKQLHNAKDFESILNILNEELRRIYAKQKIEIILWQDDQRSVKFDFEDKRYKVKPGDKIVNQNTLYNYILAKRQIILTNSYHAFCDNLNVDHANLTAHSWLGIPMIVREKVLGALVIWDDNPEHYLRLQDKQFLSTITDMVIAAIENIYLYDYISERNGSLKIFESILPDEISANTPKNVITQLLQRVNKQANVAYTGLFLKSVKHKKWKLVEEHYDESSFGEVGIELIKRLPQIPESVFRQKDHILWSKSFPSQRLGKVLQKAFSSFPVQSILLFLFDIPGIYYGCWIISSSRELKDATEEMRLFRFTFYIITQLLAKKALLDKNNQYKNYIKHLERMRTAGELASSTAHHLNNIFSIIIGKSQKLKNKMEGTSSLRDLELLLNAARDGANSIQRLQMNISQNQPKLNQMPVAVNEIIQEVVEILRPRYKSDAQERGIRYELELNLGNIKPVIGDAGALREVLFNLLNNAFDAMPEGGKLFIQTTEKEEHVMIFVSDTGIGIPENIQNKIFEPFYSTKGGRGKGLGLGIAADIIKQHRGRIYVDSILKKGSIFMVELPIAPKNILTKTNSEHVTTDFNYKILLVDDEGTVRETFAEMLKEKGCEVKMACNAEEALLKFQKHKCDIIFTDLNMPGTDGVQLAKEFKKIDTNIPVFIITGWDDQKDDMKELNDIVEGIIRKPFNMEKIMNEIKRVTSY